MRIVAPDNPWKLLPKVLESDTGESENSILKLWEQQKYDGKSMLAYVFSESFTHPVLMECVVLIVNA